MREAFGATFVVNFVIIFIAIFIFFFVAGLSYTKAFKVKNRIVDIIEENECFEGGNCKTRDEINAVLKQSGYRVKQGMPECNNVKRFQNEGQILTDEMNEYRYCVSRFDTNRGSYYRVAAFMYFDLPLGFGTMEFPVYGETKVMGEY